MDTRRGTGGRHVDAVFFFEVGSVSSSSRRLFDVDAAFDRRRERETLLP